MIRRSSPQEAAAFGSLGALRWALLQRTDDNTASHLLVKMAWRANGTFESFMSVATMAGLLQCHERTVQTKLKYLLLREYISDISDNYPQRRTRTFRLNAPAALP